MRHLFLLIMLITAINSHCQQNARYEIFKTLGSISNATTGQEVKKGDAVKLADRLIIGKDSKAGILDRQQHRIYYSLRPGTQSVASILNNAKRRADNAVATVNHEANNQPKHMSMRPIVNGVSYRGEEAENTYLQSICNTIFNITNALPDDRLTLEAIEDDGAFHFSMTNNTDSLLYINVIAVRPEGSLQLCLNIGMTDNEPYLSIAPNSQLTLSEFEFADQEPADYYMVATSEPYNSQALSLLLNLGKRFDEVENGTVIVSQKITVEPYE